MENSISRYFIKIKDPRMDRKKLYPLEEILLVALCSIISGGERFSDMAQFGELRLEILQKIYPFKHGIASEDTFGRVFSLLNPKEFRKCFVDWVNDIQLRTKKTVAIDGKTSRRTGSEGKKPLHLVSAWAHEEGLVLAQQSVAEKTNEISAMKDLLEILDLKGVTFTIDAMGCQKEIAKIIHEGGGDYILSLKGNQKTLKKGVEEVFSGEKTSRYKEADFSEFETTEKGHGRIETRYYKAIDVDLLPIDTVQWAGIKSLFQVEATREIKEKVTTEKRLFISSLDADAKGLAEQIRGHWGIENKLHWVLDMTMDEDQSRIRKGHSAENISMMRHTALNLARKDPAKKSMRAKLKCAGWDPKYLVRLLTQDF